MMVTCMNDPGTGATPDPLFNPQYSQFCYEIPFMPGQTQYMDTPVTPTSAFASAGYNNPDCDYPDATPAVSEVDGDGIGPWVSAAGTGHTLTIYALGDQMVPNNAYVGPSGATAPYNQKTIRRHYGFGSQSGVNSTTGSVFIGGVPATVSSWSDSQIVVAVPAGVASCDVQQQAVYGGSAARCGELVITTAATAAGGNVTGVTITRGGSYNTAPTVTFGAAPAGGTTATGTANLGGGRVTSVAVTNGGTGFTSAPTVTFTGGGGSGATATATVRKRVTAVTVTNPTTNCYPGTGAITVTFTTATGTGASTATGTPVTGASGTCARRVTGVTIGNAGNYAIGATIGVTFSIPTGTGAVRATGNTTVAGDTTGFVSAVTVAAAGTGTGYT